jgi:copper resistance protein B
MRPVLLLALLLAAEPAVAQRLDYEVAEEAPAGNQEEAPEKAANHPAWLQYALLDRFEWSPQSGLDTFSADASAFIGGERDRAWIAAVADGNLHPRLEYLELQALYSRNFAEDWDVQAGIRWDALPHPDRFYFTLGLQGDATDAFWIGAFAYLSHKGELSSRLVAQYNLDLPGPFVLQPSAELDAYAQDVPELGWGRGLSYGEAGLRLRWQPTSLFAPYVGYSYERLFGRTARMARAAGEDVSGKGFVAGIRSETDF